MNHENGAAKILPKKFKNFKVSVEQLLETLFIMTKVYASRKTGLIRFKPVYRKISLRAL